MGGLVEDWATRDELTGLEDKPTISVFSEDGSAGT